MENGLLPLKVIQITTVHGRYDVRVFLKQCRTLADAGHDVTLVVQDGKGYEFRYGVKIVDLGTPPSNKLVRVFLSPLRVVRYLKSRKADVIHFHDPELLPVGFLINRKIRVVVYDSHEDTPRYLLSKHWIAPKLRKIISSLFELIENYIAKRLDAIVCATPHIAKRFKLINPNSIAINNFPLLEDFTGQDGAREHSPGRNICHTGMMNRERGMAELIQALEVIKNVTLIACGPFESKAFESKLKSMSGWRFVDYRGVVSHQEVKKIMACSKVGIVTYFSSPNHDHSQPIKMFEYMGAGLPLVASNFPLWREIVEKNGCGLCVDPSSPKEVAKAIDRLLSNDLLSNKLGQSGLRVAKLKYNWENESKKLLNIYTNLTTKNTI